MKDIKTRPKSREVQVRDAAVLAPRELAKVLRDTGRAKLERQGRTVEDGTADSAAVRDAVGEFEGDVQGVTTYGSRTTFHAGKTLVQKRYDAQFRPSRPGAKTQAGGASKQDAPPATPFPEHYQEPSQAAKAKQQFRQKKAKQRQQTQREHRQFSIQAESRQRGFDLQRGTDAVDSAAPVPRRENGAPRQRPQAVQSQGWFKATGPRGKSAPTGTQAGCPVAQSRLKKGVTDRLQQSYAARAKAHATRKMQTQMARETAQKTAQTAKATAKGVSRLKDAVVRAGKVIVRAAVGLLGGAGGLIALVLVIGGAAAVIATPFGVFWSGQDADAQSIPMAVTQINSEFDAKISQIQTDNPADSVVIHRVPSGGSDLAITNWTDIVAVFAAKVAGADADATDVVTIDAERVDLLRTVFWDMNAVSYRVEVIPSDEDESDTTVLHITITSKTAAEMPEIYGFSASQRQALTEMLKPEYAQMLAELVGTYGGELELTPEQLAAMLENLPEDLPADRRAVVEQAYSLLGKVNYFWGGKSSAIGWDSRWGTPMKVTAAGSRTTGTIRPYGMDCSGFVDWVFNNALGYVIGHGGGAHMQHTYCTPISWSEALPGDLVFYPGDSHVGVFVGVDASGNPLIIHCASSQNNVVLTGLQGFISIGRPDLIA